jgi:hypothetical protein
MQEPHEKEGRASFLEKRSKKLFLNCGCFQINATKRKPRSDTKGSTQKAPIRPNARSIKKFFASSFPKKKPFP